MLNYTMKTTCKLLSLCLLSTLLLQGCATYPPVRPAHYPPPRTTAPIPPQPQFPEQVQPESAREPVRQMPKQTGNIAADFSRQAATQVGQGNLDLASATLERGLRLAPKDAMLWSQLAEVKLQQHQYRQASSLAAKSNSLAGDNTALVQKNHWIVEEARRKSGGY